MNEFDWYFNNNNINNMNHSKKCIKHLVCFRNSAYSFIYSSEKLYEFIWDEAQKD